MAKLRVLLLGLLAAAFVAGPVGCDKDSESEKSESPGLKVPNPDFDIYLAKMRARLEPQASASQPATPAGPSGPVQPPTFFPTGAPSSRPGTPG